MFLVNNVAWGGHLSQYGIVPRQPRSLPGILWAPFLHASFKHLAANTIPLLELGAVVCARSRTQFTAVTVLGTISGGALTWLFARHGDHIGASGLVFCLFGYLVSLAYFQRTLGTMALAVVCLLAYGGLLKGLLPTSTAISWEAHLAGFLSGVGLAWLNSKSKPTSATEAPRLTGIS